MHAPTYASPLPMLQTLQRQVYRAGDLCLVRALPAVNDVINAAVWHPMPGWGLAYGTKDGRVRLIMAGEEALTLLGGVQPPP